MRLLLVALLACFSGADPHKILVYNMKFAHSHSNFLGNIADILVEAGHDVTMFVPQLDPRLKDGCTKAKVIRTEPQEEAHARWMLMDKGEVDIFQFSELNPVLPFIMNREAAVMFGKTCEATLDSAELAELKKEKFDVYIVESFDICGMMLAHLLNPRAIIKTSTTILTGAHYEELGVPQPLSYNPSSLTRHLDVHSLWSRAWNLYGEAVSRMMFSGARSYVQALFAARFGPEYPTLAEISSKCAFVFTNTEPLIDFATPIISKVVDIGGLGAKEPKQLDDYWTSVVTRRPRTVLMSFGSLAKSALLPAAVKTGLLEVAKTFPEVSFVWKYEKTDDEFALGEAASVDNLILTDWMPQNDLLNHPNLAVFVTHGGMGSVQELALRGKPAILIPIFGDQPRNAAMIEHNRLGKVLSKLEVGNSKKIIGLLRELMDEPEYAENSARVARMLAKKPFSSKEKLLKYVDFAAEFGPSSALRPQSHDMSFIEYNNLDIIVLALILIPLVAFFALKAVLCLLRKCFTNKVKNE